MVVGNIRGRGPLPRAKSVERGQRKLQVAAAAAVMNLRRTKTAAQAQTMARRFHTGST